MSDRVRIFSRRGALISEFTTSVSRSYVIGERTTAQFTVDVNSSYCNEDVLNFGNWLLVESTNLPEWVGTIASRSWGNRTVEVAAFSPEYLLSKRIGNQLEKLVADSPDNIFAEIITQANSVEMSILRVGKLVSSGNMQETLHPTALSESLRRVYTRSGQDYAWRPFITEAGNLVVYGDWLYRMGLQTNFTLYESKGGGNIELTQRVLVEDAPDANYIFGYGSGSTWASKPTGIVSNADSINKYGLIQKSISLYGVTTRETIDYNTSRLLAITRNPTAVYDIHALDVGDTFSYCRLGNYLNLKMQNVGFTAGVLGIEKRVRIVGMYYNPSNKGRVELALK